MIKTIYEIPKLDLNMAFLIAFDRIALEEELIELFKFYDNMVRKGSQGEKRESITP